MSETEMMLTVTGALQASFLQPTGPSRTGIDWTITITQGEKTATVMVRTYLDDLPNLNTDQLAEAAVEYLESRMDQGYRLTDYQGVPAELTVPAIVGS